MRNFDKLKRKKILVPGGFLAILLVFIFVFSILSSNASAAVLITTSTNTTATSYSSQRKTWYDGTRYWAAFCSGTTIDFYYSTNGSSWTKNTTAGASITPSANCPDFAVDADSTAAFIAYAGATGTFVRSATSYPGTTFTWGSATTAITMTGATSAHNQISRDANGKCWASSTDTSSPIKVQVNQSGTNTCSTWPTTWAEENAAFGALDTHTEGAVSNAGTIVPISMTNDNAQTSLKLRHNDRTGQSNNESNYTPFSKRTAGVENNISMITNTTTNEAEISYIDDSNHVKFRAYDDSPATGSVVIASGAGAIVDGTGRMVVRDTSGNIYVGLNASGTCEIYKSTDNGSSWGEVNSANHPTCTSGAPVALAIDNNNTLGFAYVSSPVIKYVTMSSDTYGTPETALTPSGGMSGGCQALDVTFDSANKAQLVEISQNSGSSFVDYANRVGTGWNALVNLENAATGTHTYKNASITVTSGDIPEISYIDTVGTENLEAAVGNLNNATSFTLKTGIDASNINKTSGSAGDTIQVDEYGNTWITYANSTPAQAYVEHKSADAWSTWQTPFNAGAVSGGAESGVASGNIIYSFTNSLNRDAFNVDLGNDGGVIVYRGSTPTFPHARWSYNNFNSVSSTGTGYPIDIVYSNGTNVDYTAYGAFRPEVVVDNSGTDTDTSISYDSSTNKYYVFYMQSNTVKCKTASAPYTSWSACSGFTGFSTGTNTYLTTPALRNGATQLPMIWTNGTVSPVNVESDMLGFNSSPSAPTVSTPAASGTTIAGTNPVITLNATDADNDNVKYNFVITQTSANSGGLCTGAAQESSDQNAGNSTGWSNGAGPATQGTNVTYTIQTALTRGSTYCMQGRAIDPTPGSNSFGAWSTPQTFTVNSLPAAPTLSLPANSATSVSTVPVFNLRTTDADGDYVDYLIQVFDSSNCTGTQVGTDIAQLSSQTGWVGQDKNTNQAYNAAVAIGDSTTAIYQYQPTPLSPNHTYSWQAKAQDPGGTATYGSFSSCFSFTTAASEVRINGGTNINGGSNIQ